MILNNLQFHSKHIDFRCNARAHLLVIIIYYRYRYRFGQVLRIDERRGCKVACKAVGSYINPWDSLQAS
jgi:hypothetical protein